MVLRVGLFGCGRIAGFFHGPILGRLPNVEVTALADADPGARKRMARILPGATLYADWRRPLDLREIDAAVICLPPALHGPAAIASLEAGAHVYVEKPLALDLGEADAMIAARDKAARIGMIGFNFRHHPVYRILRDRVAAGAYGELRGVRTLFTSARRVLPGWKAQPGQGGDAISDLAMHHFDLVPFLTGERFDETSLSCLTSVTELGSFAMVQGALGNGVPVSLTAGQTTGHGTQKVELLCDTAHVTVDLADPEPIRVERPAGRIASVERARSGLSRLSPRALRGPGRDPSFEAALGAFVRSALGGEPSPGPGFDEGRAALSVAIRAAEVSSRAVSAEAAE